MSVRIRKSIKYRRRATVALLAVLLTMSALVPPAMAQSATAPADQPPAASAAPAPAPPTTTPAATPSVATPNTPAATPAQPQAGEPSIGSALLPHDLSPWGMFLNADIVVKAVIIGLAFASLVTWTVFVAKSLELRIARGHVRRAQRILAGAADAWPSRCAIAQRNRCRPRSSCRRPCRKSGCRRTWTARDSKSASPCCLSASNWQTAGRYRAAPACSRP